MINLLNSLYVKIKKYFYIKKIKKQIKKEDYIY
jgi:hypothetical protein